MKAKPASYYNEDYFSGIGGKGYKGPYGLPTAPWEGIALALVRSFGWHLGAASITDFGCATGCVLWWMVDHYGWKVKGYDFSEWAVANHLPIIDVELRDISKKGDFEAADVTLCMDVLEHITEEKLPIALANIRAATKMVLVAHVGIEETAGSEPMPEHITMHPREWWLAKFEENRFKTHVLEPYYKVQLKRCAKGRLGQLWSDNAFVLEPVAVVEEVHDYIGTEQLPKVESVELVSWPELKEAAASVRMERVFA